MKSDIDDQARRFAYIETCLYWGDGLTAGELARTFGLARQTAQGVIAAYRQAHPDAIRFDSSRKRQVAGPRFTPRYIRAETGSYLDYLRGEAMIARYRDEQDWGGVPLVDVDRLLRPTFDRDPVRETLAALHARRVVNIRYQAKTGIRFREVSPHHLVFARNRYHIRGYCHASAEYLDFVLTRILVAEPSDTEWVSERTDKAWHTIMHLAFRPNEQLSTEARQALRADHRLSSGELLRISCRKALVVYVARELLRLDEKHSMPLWMRAN